MASIVKFNPSGSDICQGAVLKGKYLLIPALLVIVFVLILLWRENPDQGGETKAALKSVSSVAAKPEQATASTTLAAAERVATADRTQPRDDTAKTVGSAQNKPCISFEQLSQTEQWRKAQEWLDGLGSGLVGDIVSKSRTSKLAHYLGRTPEQLADLIARGDASAKLVQAELNYHQARKLGYAREEAKREQALQLIQEARRLWWDAVIEGGYTTALANMGQSYYVEERILEQRGELTFNKRLELEKLSFRFGEAPEVLIEGLGDRFFEFGDMLAPVDVLEAALQETVAQVEAERARRGLPSLRTKIPPEREWVMSQALCRE